jgi:hypothetical protein
VGLCSWTGLSFLVVCLGANTSRMCCLFLRYSLPLSSSTMYERVLCCSVTVPFNQFPSWSIRTVWSGCNGASGFACLFTYSACFCSTSSMCSLCFDVLVMSILEGIMVEIGRLNISSAGLGRLWSKGVARTLRRAIFQSLSSCMHFFIMGFRCLT